MWIAFAIVNGGTNFPLDMLRYDACFPETQADVAAIDDRMDPHFRPKPQDLKPVRVVRYGKTREQAERFEVRRWNSFLWSCVVQTKETRRVQ